MSYEADRTLSQNRQLIYPVDANPDDFFPECIKFTIKKRTGMNLDKRAEQVRASMKALIKKRRETIAERGDSSNLLGDAKALLEYLGKGVKWAGDNIGIPSAETVVDFMEKSFEKGTRSGTGNEYRNEKLTIQQQQREAMGTIFMNMPNAIQYSEQANWGSQNLGVGGDMARRGMSGNDQGDFGARLGGAAVGAMGNIAGAAVGSVVGKITGALGIGSGSMGAVGGLFAGETLQKGVEAGLSISGNPYMEMMFSGIGFRNFRFDFVLRPRHRKEMEEVGLIIKSFREYSRPSWNPQFGGQSFMNYPMEFDIQFLTLEEGDDTFAEFQDNIHLPHLKPCVLTSVETNYTPQSIWAAHEAGAPVSITLGLAFSETELVMAEDIQALDWPGSGGEYGRPNPNSSEPSGILKPDPKHAGGTSSPDDIGE